MSFGPFQNNPGLAIQPGQLPSSVVSRTWDYLITKTTGGGAQAINGATGAVDYTTASTTDHSPVFQSAINALAVQNGGRGGRIEFKGQFVWNTAVTMYPGIALAGQGPLGNKGVQNTGASIQSTVNGSTLILTGTSPSNEYFPYLENLSMYGDATGGHASQNLIEINNSGGATLQDVILSRVSLFNAGQHGLFVNSASKVWFGLGYLEGCVGDGCNIAAGATVAITNSYIFGQTGNGVNIVNGGTVALVDNRIWSNGSGLAMAVYAQAVSELDIVGCSFQNNGAANSYAIQAGVSNQPTLTITGNHFTDTRGSNAVNRFIQPNVSHSAFGSITGNTFSGQRLNAIYVRAFSTNTLLIANNQGFNDTVGTVASAFDNAQNRIGIEGGSAAPVASTTYKGCTALYVVAQGGTGTAITISDPSGNTLESNLTEFSGGLPVGYGINFGAFSAAPTTTVAVA